MQPTADCVRLPLLLQVRQPTRLLQQQVCGNSKVNNKSLLRVSTGRGSLHSSRPVCANSTKSFRVLETSCRRRDPRTTPSMWSVTSRHGVNLSCRTQNRQCPWTTCSTVTLNVSFWRVYWCLNMKSMPQHHRINISMFLTTLNDIMKC